jgi:hypothetical protein
MTVYTVHEPPPRKRDPGNSPDRVVFARDGFYFWAFLLGPVWMIWRRLWLVLLIYIVVTTGAQVALWALGASAAVKFAVGLLIALLVGLEAGSMQRWTYRRRGWKEHGLVVAPSRELAERRFFDAWIERDTAPTTPAPSAPAGKRSPPFASDVIGLFPEPQSRP